MLGAAVVLMIVHPGGLQLICSLARDLDRRFLADDAQHDGAAFDAQQPTDLPLPEVLGTIDQHCHDTKPNSLPRVMQAKFILERPCPTGPVTLVDWYDRKKTIDTTLR